MARRRSPTRRRRLTLRADIVILAAGTLGSTEILLRSREYGLALSPALGSRFSGNGDTLGFAYNADLAINGIGLGVHPTGTDRGGRSLLDGDDRRPRPG